MNTGRYTKSLLIGIGLLLLTVASTNYIIDPANIYGSGEDEDNSPEAFAAQLIQSEHGLLWPNDSWSERDIKRNLASKIKDADCSIIGSSRVMQISCLLEQPCFPELSNSIVNLGVSGATLEDYLALSWELLQNPEQPRKIIFGIDPWALDWNQDSRWASYKDAYTSMRNLLSKGSPPTDTGNTSTALKSLKNLINFEYFKRSLSMIGTATHRITPAPPHDIKTGIEHPIFKPDGSLVYSEEYIQTTSAPDYVITPGDYKIKEYGAITSDSAVKAFTALIKHLKEEGIEVHFVLIPYHISLWKTPESRTVSVITEAEEFITLLSINLDVPLWGSYNPTTVGCDETDYYDYMHPNTEALIMIKQIQRSTNHTLDK